MASALTSQPQLPTRRKVEKTLFHGAALRIQGEGEFGAPNLGESLRPDADTPLANLKPNLPQHPFLAL